jgi:serine/threonine-protein kinase
MKHADRDLLVGILALQNRFVEQPELIAAFRVWTAESRRALAEILQERGALSPARRELLEVLVAEHIRRHGDDPGLSLEAIGVSSGIERALAALDAAGLQASLTRVGRRPEYDNPLALSVTGAAGSRATNAHPPDDLVSREDRFRILRPHARGGLGEVFVALDAELNREVALKQILDRHVDLPESRARFMLEAEITGGLEHPGIVPVYSLGLDAGGRPFYAMRFIRGDSLRDTINDFHAGAGPGRDPGARLLGLQKLLRRFLDVCNAIAYAHSRGVLHRDLKPANIMVGRYGETLVVDWGLAKVVGTSEATGEAALRPLSTSGTSETLPGSAIGTPSFMSPEQANGALDQLGPASDVYSLGATLYSLLTGKAPFEKGDTPEVLARVRRGDFPPPRQIQPDVPRPLEAVCLKAMALRPEDRYPDCRTLADDVERWLADEPVSAWREPFPVRTRRWVRRHRTAITAAVAVALVSLAGVTLAYRREAAINQDLREANARSVAARAESEHRLDQTIQAVEDYYKGVGEELLLGHAEFRDLRERLLTRPRAFYEQLTKELEQAGARDERASYLLARGHHGLGRIALILGHLDESKRQNETAVASLRQLSTARPDDPDYREWLANSEMNLGNALFTTGQFEAGRKAFRDSIADYTTLTEKYPNTSRYRFRLAQSWVMLGNSLASRGQPEEGEKAYRRAVEIAAELVAREPGVRDYQDLLAKALGIHGLAMDLLGNLAGAVTAYRQAVERYTRLVADDPKTPQYRQGFAQCRVNFSLTLEHAGDYASAVDQLRGSVALFEGLLQEQPNVIEYRQGLSKANYNLGSVLHNKGDSAAAVVVLRKAIDIGDELTADHPEVPAYRYDVAKCWSCLGIARGGVDDQDGAAQAQRMAVEYFSRLAADHPNDPPYRFGLAEAYTYLAGTLSVRRKLSQAVEAQQQALAVLDGLIKVQPNVPTPRYLLANGEINIAGWASSLGDRVESERAARRAVDVLTAIVSAHSDRWDYQSALGKANHSLAALRAQEGRHSEAVDAFRSALRHQRLAHEHLSQIPRVRDSMSAHLTGLFQSLLALGRIDEAAEIPRERSKLWPRDPVGVYNAACELALCMPRAEGTVQEALAAEALSNLNRAAQLGGLNPAWASLDPDLKPLRTRPEFQRLLIEQLDRGFPADPFAH